MKKIAFVPPRYGKDIGGGAETLVRELATRLAASGKTVEVFTTCARDNRTWANDFKPGVETIDGVLVRRFPVDARDLERWVPLQIRISEGMRLSIDEQLDWMAHSVNSTALYEWIARYGSEFDGIFFAPYLFGTTFWGSLINPTRSYLIPCLHDENYAYLDCIRSMFNQVAGCVFNAAPEKDLAEGLYGPLRGGEVGMGFEPVFDADALSPFFPEADPYLLYLGRKETGKGAHELIDRFVSFKESNPDSALKLVIVGGGSFDDLQRPAARLRPDIVDVAHVSELDKRRILVNAVALVQPSVNESFSIVIMEAWLNGAPVVVNAKCAVTTFHAKQSGGGLFYSDQNDFNGVVARLLADNELRRALARAGREYVSRVYSWEAVLKRFDAVVDSFARAPVSSQMSTQERR